MLLQYERHTVNTTTSEEGGRGRGRISDRFKFNKNLGHSFQTVKASGSKVYTTVTECAPYTVKKGSRVSRLQTGCH